MPNAKIIYFSKTGHTKRMAETIARGIASKKVSATVIDVGMAKVDDLLDADAIVLGSPTYYGSMAGEMKSFLDASVKLHKKLQGKVGGAFTSSGILGGGNETTILGLIQALLIHGMVVQGHPQISHYGPVAIGDPNKEVLEQCLTYGKHIGELTLKVTK